MGFAYFTDVDGATMGINSKFVVCIASGRHMSRGAPEDLSLIYTTNGPPFVVRATLDQVIEKLTPGDS